MKDVKYIEETCQKRFETRCLTYINEGYSIRDNHAVKNTQGQIIQYTATFIKDKKIRKTTAQTIREYYRKI